MQPDSFVGLFVKINMINGALVVGKVKDVHPGTHQLQLEQGSSVNLAFITHNGLQQQLDVYHVQGQQIQNLSVVNQVEKPINYLNQVGATYHQGESPKPKKKSKSPKKYPSTVIGLM